MALRDLGQQIKRARQERSLTEKTLAELLSPPLREKTIRDVESGRKQPPDGELRAICIELHIPEHFWRPFVGPESVLRAAFEEALGELTGRNISTARLESTAIDALDGVLQTLFGTDLSAQQSLDRFNRALVFYGLPQVSRAFFDRYLTVEAFTSPETFLDAVRRFQVDAVRLFSSIAQAFTRLATAVDLAAELKPLEPIPVDHFTDRAAWEAIIQISEDRLSDLGYISAARVKREREERVALSSFLRDLADKIAIGGVTELKAVGERKLRRMDSLLRKFNSTIPHGFLSPLFAPDSDGLRREADRVAPKTDIDLERMQDTQQSALRNLANYLSADYMDVYVATSMRTDADFVSVNRFVNSLFAMRHISPLRLRYFNPTQSWIEDRVAKGLVEALMLRRATVTIYMAQKEDTFGKDSEASVTLGQGKPVIVYVPRLYAPSLNIDSAQIGFLSRDVLMRTVSAEGDEEDRDLDETFDDEALQSRLLTLRLNKATDDDLNQIARDHWADFDLYGEAPRVDDEGLRRLYRSWLDAVVAHDVSVKFPSMLRTELIRVLVALATRFERRAKIFREVHPLALQVILSTGVLNGILVARSVESCAVLLRNLIENRLSLQLVRDDANYRVIEVNTNSTVRVISRNRLLASAFDIFYSQSES